jgi:hypothetical protein
MFAGTFSIDAAFCVKPERRPFFPNAISRERIGIEDRPVPQLGSNFMQRDSGLYGSNDHADFRALCK